MALLTMPSFQYERLRELEAEQDRRRAMLQAKIEMVGFLHVRDVVADLGQAETVKKQLQRECRRSLRCATAFFCKTCAAVALLADNKTSIESMQKMVSAQVEDIVGMVSYFSSVR
jgi:hypothetical protein